MKKNDSSNAGENLTRRLFICSNYVTYLSSIFLQTSSSQVQIQCRFLHQALYDVLNLDSMIYEHVAFPSLDCDLLEGRIHVCFVLFTQ